jgi:hypothetical protein
MNLILRSLCPVLLMLAPLASAGPTTAPSTQPFILFDATWGKTKPPALPKEAKSMLWAPLAISVPTGPVTELGIRKFARACRDGMIGWQSFGGKMVIRPGQLVALDFEAAFDPGADRSITHEDLPRLFYAFRDEAPGVRLTSYQFPISGIRLREQLDAITETPDQLEKLPAEIQSVHRAWKSEMDEAMRKAQPVLKVFDCICPDVYMLEPESIERDLKYVGQMVEFCHRYAPNKPVYVWTTGLYTLAKGQPHLSDDVLKRYVDAIMNSGADGCIVWGDWTYTEALMKAMVGRVRDR